MCNNSQLLSNVEPTCAVFHGRSLHTVYPQLIFFLPLPPQIKVRFPREHTHAEWEVVERVAVALPWVAVQIPMTLSALRSAPLGEGQGRGRHLWNPPPPTESSQQALGAFACYRERHGQGNKAAGYAFVFRCFCCFVFFRLVIRKTELIRWWRRQPEWSESAWFFSSRRESTRHPVRGVCLPNCNMNFHRFRRAKADWAYLHRSPAVMKLVWWKSENFAVSQEPLIFQSGNRIREGLFGVVNENTISLRWHSHAARA